MAVFEIFTVGTSGTVVIGDTVYVLYRFIPVPVKMDVLVGIIMVIENYTHGILMKYPKNTWIMNNRASSGVLEIIDYTSITLPIMVNLVYASHDISWEMVCTLM